MSSESIVTNIKDISPDNAFESGLHIRGVISLRWPYSSSERSLSIQLADEDIRRRGDKGHVRLTFNGSAAAALKNLPALCLLEISASANGIEFLSSQGSARELDYTLNFVADVSVKSGDQSASTYDSRKVAATTTPAMPKRTWMSPSWIRTTPSDTLGLDESWFSETTPAHKRARYSSSFRLVDSMQITPAKTPGSPINDENVLTIPWTQQTSSVPSSQRARSDTKPLEERFRFQAPDTPVRFELPEADLAANLVHSIGIPISTEADSSTEPFPGHIASETALVKSPSQPGNEEARPPFINSQSASLFGEFVPNVYDQGTPRSGPQVHFNFANLGSAPPTPRNVPYLSLESAFEQEDLYRKLRASAPPKSDAGSSMVADEDDETGNLAEDPKPTILETQSLVQEGILRSKIRDKSGTQSAEEHLAVPRSRYTQLGDLAHLQEVVEADNINEARDVTGTRSTIAAYGNSVDENDSVYTSRPEEQLVSRQRVTSPSMTERGAAVQESVFRSKIQASRAGSNTDEQSVRSVKSSVLVEPAAASVDGSVRENVERTMLDQQASIQETLFREKLDRTQLSPTNEALNFSLVGQSNAASSVAGESVVNEEPSMLQQQAVVQENIFRDKIDQTGLGAPLRPAPASLEYMEVIANDDTTAKDREAISEILENAAVSTSTADSMPKNEEVRKSPRIGSAIDVPSALEAHIGGDFRDLGVFVDSSAADQNIDQDQPPMQLLTSYVVDLKEDPNNNTESFTSLALSEQRRTIDKDSIPAQFLAMSTVSSNGLEHLDELFEMQDSNALQMQRSPGLGSDYDDETEGFGEEQSNRNSAADTAERTAPGTLLTGDMVEEEDHDSETSQIPHITSQAQDHVIITAERPIEVWYSVDSEARIHTGSGSADSSDRNSNGTGDDDLDEALVDERATNESSEINAVGKNQIAEDEPMELDLPDHGSSDSKTSRTSGVRSRTNSPPVTGIEQQKPSDELLTELAYHASISNLSYDRVVDLIAVSCNAQSTSTKGPDYLWSATLIQPSGHACRVSIFQAHRENLPKTLDGDVLILRNFRVQSFVRKLYLRSQQESSWAIVSMTGQSRSTARIIMPHIPVELSMLELKHADILQMWWSATGRGLIPRKAAPRTRICLSKVYAGQFFDVSGELIMKPNVLTNPFVILLTDYSSYGTQSHGKPSLDRLSASGVRETEPGCLGIKLELRRQDAKYALTQTRLGDLLLCENVLAQVGPDGYLYGSIEPELSGELRVSKATALEDTANSLG